MHFVRNVLIIVVALLFHLSITPGYAQEFDSPLGQWKTKIRTNAGTWLSHGVMTFHDENKANYTLRNGRIWFFEIDDQGKWKGHWVEDKQPWVICAEERDGSTAWGEAIFQFDPEYNKFTGTWDKCGDGKRNIWQGYRL